MSHFCTCRDTKCPLNPNNPKHADKPIGCDGCIKKCLKLGEIPSCVFNKIRPIDDSWEDFSMKGFCNYMETYG